MLTVVLVLVALLPAWACAAAPSSQVPAASRNLLTVNPGFETPGGFGGGHGITDSVPGWEVDYYSYDGFGVADSDVGEGKRALNLGHGGRLTTAMSARAAVRPGTVYQLRFQAKKGTEIDPDAMIGFTPSLLFYDQAGVLLKDAKSLDVQVGGGPDKNNGWPWQPFTVSAVAPPGAAQAGVQVVLARGSYPHEDARVGFLDNFQLLAVPETRDTVRVRCAPRLLVPGKASVLTLRCATMKARDVLVHLTLGKKVLAGARSAAPAGRGLVTCRMSIPRSASRNDAYRWEVRLVPRGGAWGQVLAAQVISGAFVDERSTRNANADSPDILYAGRWDRKDPKDPIMYWGGSQVCTRFAGTSIGVRIATPDGEEYVAVIDGDEEHLVKFQIKGGQATVATGLTDTTHSLILMKNTEATVPAVFQGFLLEAGRGLLRPEPLPAHRIEFYGDSITSGGIPDPRIPSPDPGNDGDYSGNFYRTYAGFTARALNTDYRMISKGGTGIAGSFVVDYTLLDYWNRLDFDGWHPDKAHTWDFSQWQPDAVVVAIGQNDLFRKPSQEAFDKNYAAFIQNLHAVYPRAEIFCTNTSMSGFAGGGQWEHALLPLLPKDPRLHFQLFLPGQAHGGHPRLQDHQQMAYGNVEWNGLVDWIADTMGW